MKTSVIEVRDMMSVLSVQGVEDRIGEVPGVESVTVNFSAGNATVRYDETRLDISDIKSDVRQRGYEEASEPGTPPASAKTAPPKLAAGKAAEPASTGPGASAATETKPPDDATQTAAQPPAPKAEVPDKATPDASEKMPMPEKS